MAMNVASWVRDSLGVYLGNAATTRDFRAQLRGNKPIFLWGAYLGLMILVAALAYGDVASQAMNVSSVQSRLSTFYQIVLGLLGGLIFVLAPSLTATTVVMERKRKSLDLVFSAPVSAKYYLVGKMLSGMRYTWMLLILALPVTAVGVVMGGATWGDVLAAYMMLAGAALVGTAFGLLMSVVAPTVVSAIVWTYFACGTYLVVTAIMGSAGMVTMYSHSGARDLEASWMSGINPFIVSMAAPTHTTMLGIQVPNWILTSVYSLIMCKILVLGAGSAMSGYGSAETKSLRVHLILAAAALGAVVATIFGAVRYVAGADPEAFSRTLGSIAVVLALSVPITTCCSMNADRRYRNDGWFCLRRTLTGTPSGALPFIIALTAAVALAGACCFRLSSPTWPNASFLAALFWSLAYGFFWWSLARVFSAVAKTLTAARLLTVLSFVLIVALPLPFLTIANASAGIRSDSDSFLVLHILYPLFTSGSPTGPMVFYGIFMAIVGAIAAGYASAKYADKPAAGGR